MLAFYALGFFFLQISGLAASLGGGGPTLANQFASALSYRRLQNRDQVTGIQGTYLAPLLSSAKTGSLLLTCAKPSLTSSVFTNL